MAEAPPDTSFPYPIPTRYQCIKLLGQGGSGLVYKAYDQRLKRYVAIKFARSPSIVSRHRLVNEARLLSSVDHPALCRVFDIGEPEITSSSLFMVLEYIDGKPLSKLRHSLAVSETVKVIKSLVDGVCLMHEAGYAHNDINPHNIMIRSAAIMADQGNNKAVLVDLSISAPSSPATIHRDIYQLSALLLSLLTDMEPEQFFQNPIAQRNRLPLELNRIIKKALSPEPNRRFQRCQDFQKALERWLHRHQLKQRFFWLGAANTAALAIIVSLFVLFREPTTESFLDNYSGVRNQYAHALLFAHYSQHLADEGDAQRAAAQAELSLSHFDEAISSSPDNLKYHKERVAFILNSRRIFSDAQITTMLLNAINELGNPKRYEEKSAAHHLRAKIYLGLAKLNDDQPHLVERWGNSAKQSAEAALNTHPNIERYQQLRNEIRQYQSNTGTD